MKIENILQKFIERKAKYLYTGHQKYQCDIKETKLQQFLHRVGNIASNMKEEIQTIRKKIIKPGYPRPFVNSVINQYNKKRKEQQIDNQDDYIIPSYLFEEEKPFTLTKLPFCEQTEVKSKDFLKKFHKFTNNKFRLGISWKTRKMKTLFKIKDKNLYTAGKIYCGECEHCGDNYIGETVRIQSPDGLSLIILSTSQNRLKTLKEILIMYSIGRVYDQLLHRNISGRT